jgi:thiamine kinase-like enzyme
MTALSGFTNIVHESDAEGFRVIIRQGRPFAAQLGIDRHREIAILHQIRHLGIGPELLHVDFTNDRTTFRLIPGVTLGTMPVAHATLCRSLQTLTLLHGQPCPGDAFSPSHLIRRYLELASVSPPFAAVCKRMAADAEEMERQGIRHLCHNDCVAKNWIVQTNGLVRLIDFEFSGAGDPAFDLATWSLSFDIHPDKIPSFGYTPWDAGIALRIHRWMPIVDALWALFCGVLAKHLTGVTYGEAISQMNYRIRRLASHRAAIDAR